MYGLKWLSYGPMGPVASLHFIALFINKCNVPVISMEQFPCASSFRSLGHKMNFYRRIKNIHLMETFMARLNSTQDMHNELWTPLELHIAWRWHILSTWQLDLKTFLCFVSILLFSQCIGHNKHLEGLQWLITQGLDSWLGVGRLQRRMLPPCFFHIFETLELYCKSIVWILGYGHQTFLLPDSPPPRMLFHVVIECSIQCA